MHQRHLRLVLLKIFLCWSKESESLNQVAVILQFEIRVFVFDSSKILNRLNVKYKYMVEDQKIKYQGEILVKQIEEFITFLTIEKNYAINTVSAYERDLLKFLSFIADKDVSNWDQITTENVNLFVMSLRHSDFSSQSIRRYLSSMMTLKTGLFSELRAVLMIELLYSCGLRVSELVGINVKDLDLNEGFVRVLGKGGKTRFSPIGKSALNVLQTYLTRREVSDSDALFLNKKEHRISPRSVQNIVKKRALEVGVAINVHPHMLRHAAATHFLQSSHDLRTVQEFLGHKSIKSTQVYTHLDFLELSKVYDEFHPRAKK